MLLFLFYLSIVILAITTHLISTRVSAAHFVMSKVWEPPKYIIEVLDYIFQSDYVAISTEKNISRLNLFGQISFWYSINDVNTFGVLGESNSYVIISKFSPYFTKDDYADLIDIGCMIKIQNIEVNKVYNKDKKESYLFIPYKNPEYVISYPNIKPKESESLI